MAPESCGEFVGSLAALSFILFIAFSQQIDEFRKHFEAILASIKSLKENFANTSTMRSAEIEQTIKICCSTYNDVQKSIKSLLDNGEFNYLINLIMSVKSTQSEAIDSKRSSVTLTV